MTDPTPHEPDDREELSFPNLDRPGVAFDDPSAFDTPTPTTTTEHQ